ncbi:MAG TPA: hypothetical protein VF789_03910 [Thermoanaerobaculia bacterium]
MKNRMVYIALLCLVLASSAFAGERKQRPLPVTDGASMSFEQFQAWRVWNGGVSKGACERILRRDVCAASTTCLWFDGYCRACMTARECEDADLNPFSY